MKWEKGEGKSLAKVLNYILVLSLFMSFNLGSFLLAGANDKITLDKNKWEKEKESYEFYKIKERETKEPRNIDFNPPEFTISPFLKWGAILLVIGVIVFLLYKLVGIPYVQARRNRKVQQMDIVVEDLTQEEFLKTSFDWLIEKALKAKDYRLAMRYQFLDTLQKMQQNRWIAWSKEKTNHDYLFATMGEDFYENFSQLVQVFDLVWYGERVLEKDTFQTIRENYRQFNKTIEGK